MAWATPTASPVATAPRRSGVASRSTGWRPRRPMSPPSTRSDARQVAADVVDEWEDDADDDRHAQIRRAARAEFARRGYDVTTMRDVAAAAGLGVGTVYRTYASKDDLLLAVMASYTEKWRTGWNAVLDAASSPVEKLDALAWVNVHLMDRFADEFAIQLGWLRQSPPVVRKLGSTDAQRRAIRELLTAGVAAGRAAHGARSGRASTCGACTRRCGRPRTSCGPRGSLAPTRWPARCCSPGCTSARGWYRFLEQLFGPLALGPSGGRVRTTERRRRGRS